MNNWLTFFESLATRIDHELAPTAWFSLDQQATDIYAALIADLDPMHNDPSWEGVAQWGGTIVVGTHGVCLLPWLLSQHGFPVEHPPAVEYQPVRIDRVRFIASLNVGQRARARVTVREAVVEQALTWRVKTEHTIDREGADQPFMHAVLESRYRLNGAP